jgi:hypothetical protein
MGKKFSFADNELRPPGAASAVIRAVFRARSRKVSISIE